MQFSPSFPPLWIHYAYPTQSIFFFFFIECSSSAFIPTFSWIPKGPHYLPSCCTWVLEDLNCLPPLHSPPHSVGGWVFHFFFAFFYWFHVFLGFIVFKVCVYICNLVKWSQNRVVGLLVLAGLGALSVTMLFWLNFACILLIYVIFKYLNFRLKYYFDPVYSIWFPCFLFCVQFGLFSWCRLNW